MTVMRQSINLPRRPKPIHSFIHSRIYKAPLQENYSEAPQPSHDDTNQS